MNGQIHIDLKRDAEPVGPTRLLDLVPYRVVEFMGGCQEVSGGDIVLKFPSSSGGCFILNCTRQTMFFDRSSDTAWCTSFKCLRAHDVRSILFCLDEDDKPK